MRCPYCNTTVADNAKTCQHCGRTLRSVRGQGTAKQSVGRAYGQPLDVVHIDEDVETIVYSNPVAERRSLAADWLRPLVAFGMALAGVALMGLLAHSIVSNFLHAGENTTTATPQEQEQAAQAPAEDAQPTEEQAQGQTPPVFASVSASSVLESSTEEEKNRYKPENAIDRSTATAWNEGSPGDGTGEWIEMKSEKPQHVKGIRICAGFASDEGTYYNNARPSAVTISFDDHTSVDMQLDDLFGQYQNLELEQPKDTTSVRVTIKSAYGGNSYNDCCIAEVQAY